jgi:hypothetical protein
VDLLLYNGKIEVVSFVIKSGRKLTIGEVEEAVSVVSFILCSLGIVRKIWIIN